MTVRNALNVLASRLLAFPLRREGNGAYWLLIKQVKGEVTMTLFIAGVTLEEVREATVSALFVKLEQEKKALYLGAGSEDSLNLCKSTLDRVQEDYPLDDMEKDYLRDLLQFWLSGLFLGDGFEGGIPDSSEDLRRTATTAFTYTAAIRHYCM
ncbi:hypothetical protein phi18_224 [Bacillus phage phi18]|nr:hypothetical protein phi18_027 [Bacillus phage phi18]UAV84494.1 hypothetical protein phi18_224 [Bacillus phage phi18]